jgi:hypothetical protein
VAESHTKLQHTTFQAQISTRNDKCSGREPHRDF